MNSDNYFFEKRFDYSEIDTINLIYCGVRERCFGHKYDSHLRDNYILTFINEGKAEFNINGEKILLMQNCFYVMHSKSEISYVADANVPWSISWIVTEGKQIEQILSAIGISRECPYMYIKDQRRIKNIYDEIFEKASCVDLTSKMECISLMYRLFGVLSEEKSLESTNPHVEKALTYIHAHYCEPINVQSVAAVLGLNSNYFSKLFKQNIGTSPMQYINVLKVNRAKFLLKNSDMPISEISSVIGYNDPFYFSRMFKREEKTSPLNYRYSD